ncbi:MAG: DegV family protein [Coriobacteriia bacterium]|nr:DegV family protein [Coriobacteriia bacterium]
MATGATKERIAIITDGCGDISVGEAGRRNIILVPIGIILGDGTQTDSSSFTAKDFWDSVLDDVDVLPKTWMPSPAQFLESYQQAAAGGATHILVVAMSSGLSGTYDCACQAAEKSPIPTEVIDSRAVTRGIAVITLAAADARDAGLSFDEIIAYTTAVRNSMHIDFLVDSLEYLVRGGRAGKSAQILATALKIKPVLRVFEDGSIDAYKKCRGTQKALGELAKRALEDTPGDGWRYAVAITSKPEREASANEALAKAGFKADYDGSFQVGIVVGIYCGPGTVGVFTYRRPPLP